MEVRGMRTALAARKPQSKNRSQIKNVKKTKCIAEASRKPFIQQQTTARPTPVPVSCLFPSAVVWLI